MTISIAQEQPDSVDAIELINELEASLALYYPPESRHGYSVEKLLRSSVAFFVARYDDMAAGCGGVQFFGTEYGEIKRMYVRPHYRGRGLGKRLLNHLAEYSQQHGIRLLRLETGIYQEAAISLYEHLGFQHIPPFGTYREDPLSLCFEKRLA